ncbi:MAG: acyl-CoA dehydrogenase family protein [Acidobacteriota bacterium]
MLDEIRAFVGDYILAQEEKLERMEPSALYQAFRQRGLSNWWVPKRWGGRGVSIEESVDVVSELAYGDAGCAMTAFAPMLASFAILIYGTEAQRERYLRPMAEEGVLGAAAVSEWRAGSELFRTETSARKIGSDYFVSGPKFFSTNAGFADFIVVLARVPGGEYEYKAFVLEQGTPGMKIQKRWPLIGLRSAGVYQVAFNNCLAPADRILGGQGIRVVEAITSPARIMIASMGIGICRRIRDTALDYADSKTLKGRSLISDSIFMAKVGQMEAEIETMHSLCLAAARSCDAILASADPLQIFQQRGGLTTAFVSKLLCGQLGWRIATIGSTIAGGLGFTEESAMDKLVRDVRSISIVEGGDDVMRELIFRRRVLPNWQRQKSARRLNLPDFAAEESER